MFKKRVSELRKSSLSNSIENFIYAREYTFEIGGVDENFSNKEA